MTAAEVAFGAFLAGGPRRIAQVRETRSNKLSPAGLRSPALPASERA